MDHWDTVASLATAIIGSVLSYHLSVRKFRLERRQLQHEEKVTEILECLFQLKSCEDTYVLLVYRVYSDEQEAEIQTRVDSDRLRAAAKLEQLKAVHLTAEQGEVTEILATLKVRLNEYKRDDGPPDDYHDWRSKRYDDALTQIRNLRDAARKSAIRKITVD